MKRGGKQKEKETQLADLRPGKESWGKGYSGSKQIQAQRKKVVPPCQTGGQIHQENPPWVFVLKREGKPPNHKMGRFHKKKKNYHVLESCHGQEGCLMMAEKKRVLKSRYRPRRAPQGVGLVVALDFLRQNTERQEEDGERGGPGVVHMASGPPLGEASFSKTRQVPRKKNKKKRRSL